MGKQVLCIFHSQASGSHCDDGFGAAWAVRHRLGDERVEYHPGVYPDADGNPLPPDCTDRDVILVDFSYKRPILEAIIAQANSVLILDHHKTARDDLSNLVGRLGRPAYSYANVLEWAPTIDWTDPLYAPGLGALGVTFDMERSGAGMAWDFFNPNTPRPDFINYLEDRDLWRKSLPGGDEFTIALRSYPQDFDTWTSMAARGVSGLISEGRPLLRYYQARVNELAKSAYNATISVSEVVDAEGREVEVTYTCRIANAPYFAASELAGHLAETGGQDFGASYFEVSPGQWQYSLRSRGSFDVSAIAKKFGGGGHAGAAGFTVAIPIHEAVQP